MKNIEFQEVKTQVELIINDELKTINRRQAMLLALSCIDLTTLEGSDNAKKIEEVCRAARQFKNNGIDFPNVAAVCFYPPFAAQAISLLHDTSINVACVAGAFPSGQSPLEIRLAEVRYAVEQGADEIDMVISRGRFNEGDHDFVSQEVRAHKDACGKAHLKVILETGELRSLPDIYTASMIAMEAGADFIKTSTGKINPAATLEAFYVMTLAIKEFHDKTGKMIGIKPAGGIRKTEDAINYIKILEAVLGEKWMNNEYFRLGASSLANDVVDSILALK